MDKRQERVSRFSVENFCLTMPKISVGESFTVALKGGSEKVWIGGGVSRLSVENFCPTVPKDLAEEPLCVSKNFWYRKLLGRRKGAGIGIFRLNCYVSQRRNIL